MSIFVFLVVIYGHADAQEFLISGNSAPINLKIGSQAQLNGANSAIEPGQQISGTSSETRLSIGMEAAKKAEANSQRIAIKIGTPGSPLLEPTKVDTVQAAKRVEISGVPNYYALFIGIDKYQFSSANLQDLDNPVKDASAFREILISKYAFPASNSTLLKNPTRTEIIDALEDLARRITPKDNLLIFYAGHGYWDERLKVGYWLPSNSKSDDKSGWISNSTIRDYIAGIQSKHTLLVTDACFSGSIFKTREVNSPVNEYGVSKIYQLPSRKAMTSGTLTTVPDDSKFMHYLIKRLIENTSRYLTARQLFFSLEAAVLNNTSSVPQLGVIQDTGDEGGDFIFVKTD